MKQIKVLGSGCPKCEQLLQRTREAVDDLGLECSVTKVTDIMEITSHGVMMTPALVVDGTIKASGKIPSTDEIRRMLS